MEKPISVTKLDARPTKSMVQRREGRHEVRV
jgi:hypothetical protein